MATKKAPAKKSSTRDTQTLEKAPAKRAAAKKSAGSPTSSVSDDEPRRSQSSGPRAAAPKRRSGLQLAAEAARELGDLTGREVEGVTGVERRDDGWTVSVEVLEVSRVPTTTDVLAIYEVSLDESGEIEGYRRIQRFVRGNAGEAGGR